MRAIRPVEARAASAIKGRMDPFCCRPQPSFQLWPSIASVGRRTPRCGAASTSDLDRSDLDRRGWGQSDLDRQHRIPIPRSTISPKFMISGPIPAPCACSSMFRCQLHEHRHWWWCCTDARRRPRAMTLASAGRRWRIATDSRCCCRSSRCRTIRTIDSTGFCPVISNAEAARPCQSGR
jgi:hypothetical protein